MERGSGTHISCEPIILLLALLLCFLCCSCCLLHCTMCNVYRYVPYLRTTYTVQFDVPLAVDPRERVSLYIVTVVPEGSYQSVGTCRA